MRLNISAEHDPMIQLRTTNIRWNKSKLNHPHSQKSFGQQTELNDLRRSQFFNTSDLQESPPTMRVGQSTSNLTEQFGVIDENERQGRTFGFITDFINSLTPGCVFPCTLEAFQQNRCCEVIVPPPPVCCQPPPPPPFFPPRPIPLPPPRPPPVFIPPRYPPINCCNTCRIYTYYGPPPCIRYGYGVGNIAPTGIGTGSILDSIGAIFGSTPRVSIQIPPTYFG